MAKKRKLRKSIKYSLIAIALGIGGIGGYRLLRHPEKTEESEETAASVTESETPSPEPSEEVQESEVPAEPEVRTLSLYMIGDALVQMGNHDDARREDGSYDWAPQMDGIANAAADYDLAFYNQETILGGDELGITLFPHFNCTQTYGEYMAAKGFNLVSVANNHSLDRDLEACENSMAFWNQYPDIVTAGMNTSWEDREEVKVYEKNGITYAFTAWSYSTNGWLPPEGMEYLVNVYPDHVTEMLDWVRRADEAADVVIVSMHWGTEYTKYPNDEQYDLAQHLADAGADIIIGNHPHNIQPIEWINGNTICFYALGNMLNAQTVPDVTTFEFLNTGMAASLNIVKTIEPDGTSHTEIQDVKADLLFTYNTGDYEHMYSVMYSELNDDIFPGYQEYYQYLIDDVVHMLDDSIEIGL